MFLMDTVFGHEQSIGMFNIELILIKKEKKWYSKVFSVEYFYLNFALMVHKIQPQDLMCDDNLKNQSCMISKLTLCV